MTLNQAMACIFQKNKESKFGNYYEFMGARMGALFFLNKHA